MKKIQNFFLMGTVALTGMAGMTACSSDSEPSDGNQPGIAGQVVKTQFALNIPYGGSTRMTAANTQQNGEKFLGIQKLQLLAFNTAPADGLTAAKSINIGSGDNAYQKDMWRSVYRDVEIPVGTNNFVLYGMASRATGMDEADLGYLSMPSDYNEMKDLANIKFGLKAIAPNVSFSNDDSANAIITQLNNIANATITAVNKDDAEDTKEVSWKEIGSVSEEEAAKYNLGSASERETLKKRYENITSLKAGSAASVNALIQGLIDFFGDESAISESKKMTKNIISLAKAAKTALSDNKFPRNHKLPDGVANISWNAESNTFAYVATPSIGHNNNINYNKIAYPAALAYFISSPAMSSEKELQNVSGLPNYTEWCKDEANWTESGFTEASVTSQTRSVALKKALQYGVANLKLSVRCASSSLEDNAKDKGYEKDNIINIGNGGFPVTAVLIGGQPSEVKWNMEPSADNAFDYTVYDTKMNGDGNGDFLARYQTSPTDYNYTLLLDNNNNADNGKVYVTVELENKFGDFYGSDGLVPNGGKFYLVGLLDVNADSGVKDKRDRVFEKDYTTTVNLNIKDLKSAYNCIPDLRSSKISLGLAVDMDWTNGITFDIDLK